MAVIALSMETGAFGELFVDDLAAELGVKVIDLRPLELGIAETLCISRRRRGA